MTSLIYAILRVPVTDAGPPVWTTNSKRSVDVEMMYVLHNYSYVDYFLDKHTGYGAAHTSQDFTNTLAKDDEHI